MLQKDESNGHKSVKEDEQGYRQKSESSKVEMEEVDT